VVRNHQRPQGFGLLGAVTPARVRRFIVPFGRTDTYERGPSAMIYALSLRSGAKYSR
jgi:hypothetical protein